MPVFGLLFFEQLLNGSKAPGASLESNSLYIIAISGSNRNCQFHDISVFTALIDS